MAEAAADNVYFKWLSAKTAPASPAPRRVFKAPALFGACLFVSLLFIKWRDLEIKGGLLLLGSEDDSSRSATHRHFACFNHLFNQNPWGKHRGERTTAHRAWGSCPVSPFTKAPGTHLFSSVPCSG